MKIARLYGIDIKLRPSTLFIVFLVAFYAASFFNSVIPNASIYDLVLVGFINGLIILFSILAHELMHSVVAQKYGLKVSEIELYLFGGASKIEEEPRTPKSELVIAIVGPVSSLIIGFTLLTVLFLSQGSLPAIPALTLLYSGFSNIGLGIFNLLPAFPIDGGRVLRAILWSRRKNIISATKTASKVGSFFAYGLIAYGIIQTFLFGVFNGFWLVIMGSFLNTQTKQAYLQTVNDMTLSNLTAKNIMTLPKLEIPFNTTLSDAIKYYFIPYKKSYFPVIQGSMIVGIIDVNSIKKIPEEQRDDIIVGYLMERISNIPQIMETDTGKTVLKKLRRLKSEPYVIAVKEENEIILGLIGEEDIINSMKFCQLNPDKC